MQSHKTLSRRERQIMDILYRSEKATAVEVMDLLPDPPSYSAVRALLRILEEKGHVHHEQVGPRYVYMPTLSQEKAKRSALDHVVTTFFNGSISAAVATLLDSSESLSDKELESLSHLIDSAKKEGC